MTIAADSLAARVPKAASADQRQPVVGVATRGLAWVIDAVLINLVAIITGIGISLILAMFPLTKDVADVFKPIAGAVYILWCAVYFVTFWATTGQTPGARLLQIRLVRPRGTRIKAPQALVRWIGMNLAMLPLCAGYLPLLWGRRDFADWLARTLVVEAPELSLAQTRKAQKLSEHQAARRPVTARSDLSGR